MEMYLLHEHMARAKQFDHEREIARDILLRQVAPRTAPDRAFVAGSRWRSWPLLTSSIRHPPR